ncbi:hypothetical protein E2C01_017668 [Portunus trituberculatus]|uniref:Uncharacterized protein n=1 Tax=Portunus trituberculatus TaxID=210409 RepID=A0A5B7DSF2_PORTR|nr:hypothetical protein [Portunus trituberculatus]
MYEAGSSALVRQGGGKAPLGKGTFAATHIPSSSRPSVRVVGAAAAALRTLLQEVVPSKMTLFSCRSEPVAPSCPSVCGRLVCVANKGEIAATTFHYYSTFLKA